MSQGLLGWRKISSSVTRVGSVLIAECRGTLAIACVVSGPSEVPWLTTHLRGVPHVLRVVVVRENGFFFSGDWSLLF